MRTIPAALSALLLVVAGVACSPFPGTAAPPSSGGPGVSTTSASPRPPGPDRGLPDRGLPDRGLPDRGLPDRGLPDRLVADVTGAGAWRHLEELQRIADANGGNRALGTPGYDASVDHVADVLRGAGYDVTTPEFVTTGYSVRTQRLTVHGRPIPVRVLALSPATPPGGLTAPLAVADGEGCDAASLPDAAGGSVLLVRRGSCPFRQKAQVWRRRARPRCWSSTPRTGRCAAGASASRRAASCPPPG